MAMPLRLEWAGACYHVINWGLGHRKLFGERGAAAAFEQTLAEAAIRAGWRVHAYIIMPDHYHLAVELTQPNLSESVGWLQATWARRSQGARSWGGKPFQGRFKALLVERGATLTQVVNYIHLNPSRTRGVPPARLAEYTFSSLPKFPEKTRPAWLEPAVLLAENGRLSDTAAGWRRYLTHLQSLAADPVAQLELAAARLTRGWCLGSPAFRAEMRKLEHQRAAELRRGGKPRRTSRVPERVSEAGWDKQLREMAGRARIDLKRLGSKKSDASKIILATAMKLSTTVTNAWLGERLGIGKPASVSQFTRRLRLQPHWPRALQLALGRVKR